MKKVFYFLSFLFILNSSIYSQFTKDYKPLSSAEIQRELESLKVLGSALYIAAHPDDENTQLISYLSKDKLIRTAYFSFTRGDGGQNLIGTETGASIGLIRTHELLEARKLDGGQQFFSRAIDFGYSKTSKETLKIWDKEKALADLVWVIRKFKPDVLITRFPPEKYQYPTHGHHQASADLAELAYEYAGDKSKFPEQLEYTTVWKPKRLIWNTSPWFYARTNTELDTSDKIIVNVGGFDQIL